MLDDNRDDRVLLIRELRKELGAIDVVEVGDASGLERALGQRGFDLVITDHNLGWTDGLVVLRAVKARWPDVPVVMYTGPGTEEVAVELAVAVRSAIERARRRREARAAQARFQALIEHSATVYGIVKQSDGFIWVYSEPGHGTTFKIYLPRFHGPEAGATRRPAAPAANALGTETVLLVEDEAAVRSLARRVLERQGYRVLEAPNADEALARCHEYTSEIHLLLTDVVMPGLGGRALATKVAELRPEIRILYMSGYTDDAVVRHGVLAAEVAYLPKPFTPEGLASKVREVLNA